MNKNGPLDSAERSIRLALGVVLVLLAWGFGWTSVEAVGALLLGFVALVSSVGGYAPEDRLLAKLDS